MEDDTPPWLLEVADNLFQAHVDIQQKIVVRRDLKRPWSKLSARLTSKVCRVA
jgi:hypothetical protein